MTDIPRAQPDVYAPGSWCLVTQDECGDAPYYTARIYCPKCEIPLTLQRGHHIAADGSVTPSVGHPDPAGLPPQWKESATCDWHPTVRLLDWPNLPAPQPRPFSICAKCGKQSRGIGGWGTWGNPGIICAECLASFRVAPPEGT